MEQSAIYLWSIIDNISNTFSAIMFISSSIILILFLIGSICQDNSNRKWLSEDEKKCYISCRDNAIKYIKFVTIFLIIATIGRTLIPCKQDLALIFAYPYIKRGAINIVQLEPAKKIMKAGNLYLDSIINSLEKGE